MMTTENNPNSSQLPAHFLAYKQKSEEASKARMGNTNCWGSFSFLSSDPRPSNSSSGIGSNHVNVNTNSVSTDNFASSERSYGSHNHQASPTNNIQASSSSSPTSEMVAATLEKSSGKMSAMWNSFSGRLKSTVTGVDDLEVPQTHSAELGSKAGFPTNKQMTNVDRLKSMAASAVQKPEIPDAPEQPQPAQDVGFHKQHSYPGSQSSFPSLASSQSDGSSSLESSTAGGRSWLGSKMFGAKPKATGIGSHQDPSIGELKADKSTKSFFPSSMLMTSKKVEEKKDIDIEKLKRLRDQAAGLVPKSPSDQVLQEEKKEDDKVADTPNLESQIDDLEKEMGLVSATPTPTAVSTPPRLRMDGFDDVHEEAEAPKKYAEIKVTPSAVSHLDNRFQGMPKNVSPSLALSSPKAGAAAGGLSTGL